MSAKSTSELTPVKHFDSPLSTPPSSTSSSLPSCSNNAYSPNNSKYFNDHLNKSQFNLIHINAAINLLKILYPKQNVEQLKLKFFMVEVLRRSKTSIQSLQICSYYIFKLIRNQQQRDLPRLPACPKKLFLGLLIVASKFNQDHNYSFKSWLRICGCKDEESNMSLQALRHLEVDVLQCLQYDCYVNGLQYENWCNILVIFGYDFIQYHKLMNDGKLNELSWYSDTWTINVKLFKWCKFLMNLSHEKLKSVKISFENYYNHQLGKKILIGEFKSSLVSSHTTDDATDDSRQLKRTADGDMNGVVDEYAPVEKKARVACK